MVNSPALILCVLALFIFDNSLGKPTRKLRLKRQAAPQSSALGALMSFSVKLSDMERQITSYERTIQRQRAEIDQLSAKLDSKADRSQFRNLQTLLNSKMVTLKDEVNTKDLVIERYRNKLRQLEADVKSINQEYSKLSGNTLEVLDRFDDLGFHCTNQKTGWAPKASGEIQYLDRQWVRCNPEEFLQSFVLKLATNHEESPVQYVYRCCSINI
ncbi:hypothetical protein OS493_030794 [Desmophyllum pertusum]|uniref:Uncharacterized protein n=1 Tax=Desmophyllum pertusum TaxID=174260 RepID=A0A9X0CQN1_9CNID|nr:hypothetical protein OS493_030794 [Desmophyllum pertusum]